MKKVELNRNRIIPIFDCDYDLFDNHLEFYTALGFNIVYYQKAPYRFASVRKEGIGEFSFYGVKNFKVEGNTGGCYVVVPNIREVYEQFKVKLKDYYGKIPSKGMPRVSRLNKTEEDWRVNITDASGNYIIIGESIGDSIPLKEGEGERDKTLKSKFERAYEQAYRFAYSKEDFLAARNTLEVAFHKLEGEISNEVLFKALVLQAEIFNSLGQFKKSKDTIQEADNIELTISEKEKFKDFVDRLSELQLETNQ